MARRDTYVIEFRTTGTARVKRDIASIGKSANSSRRALAFLRSFLVIFASVAIFSGVFRLADAFTNLTNRLKVLSNEVGVIQSLRGAIFNLANEVRLPVEAVAESFVRFGRATLRLGLNFRELVDITKTVSIAVQLSGATATEAAGGLQQLSQGLAAGALQGEELRSVVEQLPRVADLIAKEFIPELIAANLAVEGQTEGLGGLLRALNKVTPGVLETSRVIKAFVDAGGNLDELFKTLKPTIGQAFSVFRNQIVAFAGNLNEASGIADSFAQAIIKLSFHVDKLILGFAAFVGVFALNILISQVVQLGGRVLVLVAGLFKIGQAIGTATIALVRFLGFFASLGTGIAVVAGVILAWERWGEAIQQTITEMGGLANIAKVTLAFIIGLIITVRDEWDLVVKALPALFLRAMTKVVNIAIQFGKLLFNTFIETFSSITRAVAQFGINIAAIIANALAGNFEEVSRLAERTFGPELLRIITDPLTVVEEKMAAIVAFFEESGVAADQLGTILSTNVAEALTVINEQLANLEPPGINPEDLEGSPIGSTEAVAATKALTAAELKLVDAFNSLIASIDPVFDRMLTLKEATDTYTAGVKLAGGSTFELEEVLRRVDREFLGVGNTVTDVAAKTKNLNDAYALGRISALELAIAQKELNEELLGAAADLEKAVSPIAAFYSELEDAQNAVALAVDRGALSQDKANEILRRTERELLGVGNATEIYEEKMVLLNAALIRGTISQEEFRNAARETRIEVLEDQRTMAAGIERAMLKIEETYSNTAANVEQAFTTVFQNLEDRLVDFIETGEFSIREFLDTIRQEISRAFIREAIGELTTIFNDVFGNVLPGAGEDPEAAASQVLVAAKTAENAAVQAATVAKNAEVIAVQAANAAQQAQILAVQAITGEFTFMQQPLLTINTLLTPLGTTILPAFAAACQAATICLQQMCATAGADGEEGSGTLGSITQLVGVGASLFGGGGGGGFGSVNDGGSAGGQGTGNFDLANQGSFRHGGRFTIGGNNSDLLRNAGADNRLVQFQGQAGEDVEITPRGGRQRGGGSNVTINFNGETFDDRFKRNQLSTTARVAGAVNRAGRRTS